MGILNCGSKVVVT